jgi:hypothetical protein
MERLDREVVESGIDVDMADRRGSQAAAGAKAVDQAVASSRGGHLFSEMTKDLQINSLDLETALVFEARHRSKRRGSLVTQMAVKKQAGLGQKRFRPAENFRDGDGPVLEVHGVSTFDHPQIGTPLGLFEAAEHPGREPIRVESAVEHMKRDVGDP